MHLLATQSGVVDGGAEAVDLGQSPGDIVFISAADSELSGLAAAYDRLDGDKPSLRLANQMALSHNLSVDTYLENTAQGAKLIVARVLGGVGYWRYGIEQLRATAGAGNIALILLPGGGEPDDELTGLSLLDRAACERLRGYFAMGGPQNYSYALAFMHHLIGAGDAPPMPAEFPKAGVYWPGAASDAAETMTAAWQPGAAVAAITFYRALIEGALTAPIDALISGLQNEGLNPLPVFVSSLKDEASIAVVKQQFDAAPPAVVLNTTGFAVTRPGENSETPLTPYDCPVLQVVLSGMSRQAWLESSQGLGLRDLAMNVVMPELDGRILARAVSFKSDRQWHEATQCRLISYAPEADRIAFTTKLARNWTRLRQTPADARRIAVILANYPNRDGRIGNGVGYDTPASTLAMLKALKETGYETGPLPDHGNTIIERLQCGPTNAGIGEGGTSEAQLPLADYQTCFEALPASLRTDVIERWGAPLDDPFQRGGVFHLPVIAYGNILIGIQPARGYNIDPKESYHDPALVPPHGYLAFYFWLRRKADIDAVIHNGKHGNLEWLPGKATGLSASCYPEAALGPIPHLYPFIVNDPGEGTQAKRRSAAVIIDHLTPPLTRAESYGPYRDLETLVDEYYLATGLDERRLKALKKQILDLTRSSGLDRDAGFAEADDDHALQMLDTYLCDLKEAQIRDGLHILGESPSGDLERDLLAALVRSPRNLGEAGDQSLIRALAMDFGFGDFDPFGCDLGRPWDGKKPLALEKTAQDLWRSNGDTVERLELFALELIDGSASCPGPASALVLEEIDTYIRPRLRDCGAREMTALLAGLDGRFVEPGPSGAPTRGRLDVLPTGRNFYSIDNRTLPTPTAWSLGMRSAEQMLLRHFQETGRPLTSIGLSVWGTSNMRTGGDDIAQALALIGAKPVWDSASWRVTGFEVIPLAQLARPRVDVTLRISGFFRDAFPSQIELFDKAIRAIGALDEPEADNPIAARMMRERGELVETGLAEAEAERLAGFRIFGSKPGAYGAGLQALIDEKLWAERQDLAAAYVTWGAYAYGLKTPGERQENAFKQRLKRIEAVVHNQDNREHDLLDSDDYYQFEGGMTAAVEAQSGARPIVYHNDHSRPERPVTRTLEEEIGRVVRSRVANPKWINGVKRHGYKGAFEIAATVDYMFAFAATTGAVKSHHFDLAYDAYLGDAETVEFLEQNNREALAEIAQRFEEAFSRGLWTPRSNSAYDRLKHLAARNSAP